jgi:hypothetical protein
VTTQAWRATGTWGAWAHTAILVNITSLIGEGSLAVQSAALARDKLASLLFGHVLVASIASVNRRGASTIVGKVRQSIYVEGSLATAGSMM